MGSVRNLVSGMDKVAALSEALDVFSTQELDAIIGLAKEAQANPYYNAGQNVTRGLGSAVNWLGNAATDAGNWLAPGTGAWGLVPGVAPVVNTGNFFAGLFGGGQGGGQAGNSMSSAVANSVGNVANTAGRIQAGDMKDQYYKKQMADKMQQGGYKGPAAGAAQQVKTPVKAQAAPQQGYGVQAGDTLWGIARQQGMTDPTQISNWVRGVANKNNIANPNQINVGQTLRF